jgi:hypothetical protein
LWSYLKGSRRITAESLAPAKNCILRNVNKAKLEKQQNKPLTFKKINSHDASQIHEKREKRRGKNQIIKVDK